MEKYEIMYILQATLDENARKAEIEKLHGILKANKIAVTDVKEWGVKDFAYVIKKQTKGYYVVIKANGEAKGLAEFDRLVRLDPLVIRHLITIDQD